MIARIISTAFLALAFASRLAAAEPDQAGTELFEKKIRPALVEHCHKCHSAEAEKAGKLKGGLRLDSAAGLRTGGDSGPAVVAGDAAASLLVSAIRHDDLEMPPERKLPDDVIADFVRWIETGAPWPNEANVSLAAEQQIDWQAARQFWSFQRPTRHPLPQVRDTAWPRRPIDYFVLARIDDAGLTPNESADPRTLIRRVSFDLTGLPPTPDEVEGFLQKSIRNRGTRDGGSSAFRNLVDRLLASPRYGEHLARMWLDLARYAEDQAHIVGNNNSLTYPNAYLYRDWVIEALNDDLPYDEFVKLQLAADLLQPDDGANHAALGFIGLGPKYYRRNSLDVMADEWEDRVDTVSRGLLGMTVACARCHDHKFDPIETEDYYALAGVFASTEMFNRSLDGDGDQQAKKPENAIHIVREGKPHDLNVFVRGNVENKGPLVPRRFLRVLLDGEPQPFAHGSGRLELAEQIADPNNPLTARVIVNRVWAKLLGRPLVATPSNFGALGQRPTHPQLLDDLAVRFMESGWSLKWLHREIVLSATYRQSSRADAASAETDQANQLLWRAHRKRLSIEQWRDAILAATGELQDSIGGRSFQADAADQRRRTVYARVSRLELNKMLAMFDFPEPNVHAAKRAETTTALQKLFVLNSPFMARRAAALARLLEEKATAASGRVALDDAFLRLYSRPATEDEATYCLEFIEGPDGDWQQVAQVLLAANEMMFID